MAKLSKSAAARQLGISRTTLYKLIEQGAMSATPDGMIDSAELVRVAPLVDSLKERTWTSMDSLPPPQEQQPHEQRGHSVDSMHEQPWTPVHERARTSTLQDLVDTLREQMQLMRDELQAAREERALLLQMLQDMQHRYDRLLDMPRTLPAPSPQDLRGAPQPSTLSAHRLERHDRPTDAPGAFPGDPRGAMRRRIVALLQAHPAGLTPAQMRTLLGVERSLGDTCLGMRRDGLLQRVGPGRYVTTGPSRPH